MIYIFINYNFLSEFCDDQNKPYRYLQSIFGIYQWYFLTMKVNWNPRAGIQKSRFIVTTIYVSNPQDPCMVYLPTCTIRINQMRVNILYMDPMGSSSSTPRGFHVAIFTIERRFCAKEHVKVASKRFSKSLCASCGLV